MNKLACIFFVGLMSLMSFAEPTVTDVVAKQRYPWNGLVDITCKVEGMTETTKVFEFFVSAIVSDLGITNRLSNFWIIKDGVKSSDRVVGANGNYRLLWDAKADLGEVRCTNMIVRVALIVWHDKVQLWEGGPYWATTNIGAEKPEDYGYYFWWGDTVGYKRENNKWVASDGSNSNFSFSENNAPTYNKSHSTLQGEGWITSEGVLAPEHDAARKHWGGDWRMPTDAEFDTLINNCDWTWTNQNGVYGYIVRGRGRYAFNSIFIPATNSGDGTSFSGDEKEWQGRYAVGHYWSSAPVNNSEYKTTWYLLFSSQDYNRSGWHRDFGFTIRPIIGFTK